MAGYLKGLEEYLAANYGKSAFDDAVASPDVWTLHEHGGLTEEGTIDENLRFDIRFTPKEMSQKVIPKVTIKFLYPSSVSESVKALLKIDDKIRAVDIPPMISPASRYHIKNKTLYPAMKDRTVLFFTLLEGEILKGIITDFSRYEITLSVKGGIPVTILRHAVYDLRDKKGRCLLKAFQNIHKDWEKSSYFVSA